MSKLLKCANKLSCFAGLFVAAIFRTSNRQKMDKLREIQIYSEEEKHYCKHYYGYDCKCKDDPLQFNYTCVNKNANARKKCDAASTFQQTEMFLCVRTLLPLVMIITVSMNSLLLLHSADPQHTKTHYVAFLLPPHCGVHSYYSNDPIVRQNSKFPFRASIIMLQPLFKWHYIRLSLFSTLDSVVFLMLNFIFDTFITNVWSVSFPLFRTKCPKRVSNSSIYLLMSIFLPNCNSWHGMPTDGKGESSILYSLQF